MITGQLKNTIDKLWEEFWTGGITNPLTVIEQISFLMFMRLLDLRQERLERTSARSGKESENAVFLPEEQNLRWSQFKHLSGDKMLPLVRDEAFPFLRRKLLDNNGGGFSTFFQDASFLIQKPSLLVSAVAMIDKLPLTEGDTKGDLYEYLLSKLTTAGINGQFRTPRHIIRMMVEMLAPQPSERVADPACGTAGFLVETMQYFHRTHTSPEMVYKDDDGSDVYPGDLLEDYRAHLQSDALYGFEFDITMLRIAALNLFLHGIDEPNVKYADTLGKKFDADQFGFSRSGFDVILANPPFTGSLDLSDVAPSLQAEVKTKKTELLFLALILRMLKTGGRAAVIVPDGVLFGSSLAHRKIRETIVEKNQLEGIVSMPSGVFKPYAGVSTAVMIFTKGGSTKNVWFYDMKADGFSLDDKRTELGGSKHENDNIPDVITRWKDRGNGRELTRTDQSFLVPKEEIVANGFDLSVNRYKETVYDEVSYDPPKQILMEIEELEAAIQADLKAIGEMIV
jgi:type I restriction enzyme M protein